MNNIKNFTRLAQMLAKHFPVLELFYYAKHNDVYMTFKGAYENELLHMRGIESQKLKVLAGFIDESEFQANAEALTAKFAQLRDPTVKAARENIAFYEEKKNLLSKHHYDFDMYTRFIHANKALIDVFTQRHTGSENGQETATHL
ncbi:hypothetical protein OCT63_17200 [Vibrio sp. RW]|uniref:hypothetical protein n=1 Tax=Vibrio sp. RW TaxID=2998833 RepID=UPI0022CD6F87|nr:hypothetical protein [Vibrio sp. RW]MDA0145965.1 hypothetical protein [Vibrio sp. RW]